MQEKATFPFRLVEFPDVAHAPALLSHDQIEAIATFLTPSLNPSVTRTLSSFFPSSRRAENRGRKNANDDYGNTNKNTWLETRTLRRLSGGFSSDWLVADVVLPGDRSFPFAVILDRPFIFWRLFLEIFVFLSTRLEGSRTRGRRKHTTVPSKQRQRENSSAHARRRVKISLGGEVLTESFATT